jgi:metal-dependent amidase/aminoacylase/carboxypeptidase family protein
MTAADLKASACRAIDAHAAELERLARDIFDQPELGFK